MGTIYDVGYDLDEIFTSAIHTLPLTLPFGGVR